MTKRTVVSLMILALAVPVIALAALPLTPSTTYVANSPPPIKAQDLNDLQKYLAGLYSATYSVKALTVDGTGGNAASPPAGTVTVATSLGGFKNTAPFNTGSIPWGSMSRESALLCGGRCTLVAGTITGCGGPNIRQVVKNGTGDYIITCDSAGPNANRHFVTVTPLDGTPLPVVATVQTTTIVSSGLTVRVHFFKLDASDYDPDGFMFTAFGG